MRGNGESRAGKNYANIIVTFHYFGKLTYPRLVTHAQLRTCTRKKVLTSAKNLLYLIVIDYTP
jgi:hypothetical protein